MPATRVDQIRDRDDFAAALTELRLRAGLSLRRLGQAVDRPMSTIHGWFTGRHLPYPRDNELFTRVLEVLGVDDTAPWMEALFRVRDGLSTGAGLSANPYRGLDSFGVEDADVFFGRTELVDDLVRRVDEAAGSELRVLFVVGASGSGKSSVVHAGLASSLAGRAAVASVRPGVDPLGSLLEGSIALDELSTDGRTRVLIVDQLEELFTLCGDDDRDAFATRIHDLAADTSGTIVVLVARSDFFADIAHIPALASMMQDRQVIVGPIDDAALRACIVGPAATVGAEVDDDLVATLLKDLGRGTPNNGDARRGSLLPLLSEALFQTVRAAKGNRLTVSDYLSIGGVDGCIERSAERAWSRLSEPEQALLRRLVPRLVNAQGDTITRRPLAYAELQGLAAGDAANYADLIRSLAAARVLTATEDSVEFTHEALLTSWPRLRSWIDDDHDRLRLQRQLGDAALTWHDGGRSDADLLVGTRLELVRSWSADPASHDLNQLEAEFLERSVGHADRAIRRDRQRTRRLRVAVAASVAFGLAAGGLALAANSARSDADTARDEALSRQLALRSDTIRATDPAVSAQVAAAAAGIADTLEARSALFEATATPRVARILGGGGPTALSITADGHLAAVSNSTDGTIQLITDDDGVLGRRGLIELPDPDTDIYALELDASGSLLAAGGTDNTVSLWDISDPDRPTALATALEALPGSLFGLGFTADSTRLVYASAGGALGVLDITDRAAPTVVSEAPSTDLRALDVSVDSASVATAEIDGTVTLWGLEDDTLTQRWSAPGDGSTETTSVTFSPSGDTLAVGYKSGTLRLWDLAGAEPTELDAPSVEFTSWVNSVAFSADGGHLAAGSSDRGVRIWSTATWGVVQDVELPDAVTELAFDDGGDLFSVATDGGLRRWDLTDQFDPALDSVIWTLQFSGDGSRLVAFGDVAGVFDSSAPTDLDGPASQIAPIEGTFSGAGAISADGRLLAIGGGEGGVDLYDVADPANPALLARLADTTEMIASIAFDASGTRMAVGGNDRLVRMYDVSDPSTPRPEGAPIDVSKDIVFNVALSADGGLLAITGYDGLVHLLDVATPGSPTPLADLADFGAETGGVAFSPDGSLLAVGSANETTIVWDVSDPTEPRPLGEPITGPEGSIFALSFSGDGRYLAAAVTDNSVWVWDLEDPAEPQAHARLESSEAQVYGVGFHPSEPLVAAAGADTDVRMYTVDRDTAIDAVCASVGDVLTTDEWKSLMADDRDVAAC